MEFDLWQWICSAGIARKQIQTLLAYFGNIEDVYHAPAAEFEVFEEHDMKWVKKVYRHRDPEKICDAQKKRQENGIRFVGADDLKYPYNLRNIIDYPYGLFYKGELPENGIYHAAIVGARSCTTYGALCAADAAQMLTQEGIPVVSGLAVGIDGIAQNAVVESGGKSYGVLGCGVDICYPKENISLYMHMQQAGAVLSEFACGAPPIPVNFPIRNRIISGIADAVIVVEARRRSGSLITAGMALEQGRDVYAFPGKSGDVLSGGCNELIAAGAAKLVLSPEELCRDLLESAGRSGKKTMKNSSTGAGSRGEHDKRRKEVPLAPDEELVYSYLDLSPLDVDSLVRLVKLPVSRVRGALTGLVLKDLAKEYGKDQYTKAMR